MKSGGTEVMNAKKILPMRIHWQEDATERITGVSVHQSGSGSPQSAKNGRSHGDDDFQDCLPHVFIHFAHSFVVVLRWALCVPIRGFT